MFTKSGKKLVPVSFIRGNNPASTNGPSKPNNHLNGQIQRVLDDLLVPRDCSVTTFVPVPISKIDISEMKTTNQNNDLNSKQPIQGEKERFIFDELPLSPQKSQIFHIQTEESTSFVQDEFPSNQVEKPQYEEKVFNALKAKDILTVLPTHVQPQYFQFDIETQSAESPKKFTPLVEKNEQHSATPLRKTVNGTEYVPYTPQAIGIQRDREIQVYGFIKKQITDAEVQCDSIEDDDSSERSQTDWINEIIEEYEFIEDDNMHECHICGEVSPSLSSNLKHSIIHKETSLLCFRCGRLFPNNSKLLEHEDKMHLEDSLKIKKALRCPKINCLKAFHSKRQLFNHIDQHSNKINDQRCSKCQRSFSTPLQLLCHTNRRNCWR